jgi:uncharacterized protein (TIGR02996 family)
MTEREVFEQTIRENPRDFTARKIFADWLDEHDEPEEADKQRRWDDVKQDSWEWLERFLQEVAFEGGRSSVSVEELLGVAESHLNRSGDWISLSTDTPEICFTESEEMWKHIGVVLGEDTSGRDASLFTCSC